MNLSELTALLANGESDRVEFKTSTAQLREATKTVCALLNGLGGFVFFGVTPDGKAVGQQVSTRTLEELTNELRRIEPPVSGHRDDRARQG